MRKRLYALVFLSVIFTGFLMVLELCIGMGSEGKRGTAVALKRSGIRATLSAGRRYRSPFIMSLSPDEKILYVSDRTAACVVVVDAVE